MSLIDENSDCNQVIRVCGSAKVSACLCTVVCFCDRGVACVVELTNETDRENTYITITNVRMSSLKMFP